MPITPQQYETQLAQIRDKLADQGMLVATLCAEAFGTIYARDLETARSVMNRDDEVDQVDIEVEREAVDLLIKASHDICKLDASQIRSILTAVKVNNELERIADAAAAIADRVVSIGERTTPFPQTTRVMTNSVTAIIRDTVKSFDKIDAERAKGVLAAEGTVLKFQEVIVRDCEERVADGRMEVDLAFDLHAIINLAVVMADHCTNIAEQVIYQATGAIVRHTTDGWVEQELPEGE
jgi:phosphate transport system protein